MRPAVENAATRNEQILQRKRLAQASWNVCAICSVTAFVYFFAGVGPVVLGFVIIGGLLGGIAIKLLRAFGEQFRLTTAMLDGTDREQAGALRAILNAGSRSVLAGLVVSVVTILAVAGWVAMSEGHVWVVLVCIVALAYALSSVEPLSPDASSFMKFTYTAQQKGCRIAVFRPFDRRSSTLARSALIPILAGYGKVDIVLDETFERAESDGEFGGQVDHFDELCTVHRFADSEWKDRVAEIIRDSDIAIIDWTTISPGVLWEIAQCYMYLPPYRIYGVVDGGVLESSSLKHHMSSFYDAIAAHPEMPEDVRPYIFYFAPGASQQMTLAIDIHRKMLEIIAIEEYVQGSG
jgi:hypothetical protein